MAAPINDSVAEGIAKLGLDAGTSARVAKAYRLASINYRSWTGDEGKSRTRKEHLATLDRIAQFNRSAVLEVAAMPSEYGEELATKISRLAALERDVPLTDNGFATSERRR